MREEGTLEIDPEKVDRNRVYKKFHQRDLR
jgi:hypothetical protein